MLSEITSSGWYAPDSGTELGRGVNFQLTTSDLNGLVQRLREYAYPIKRDVYESWRESWGELGGEIEIHLFDPDEYFLRFSELIGKKEISR